MPSYFNEKTVVVTGACGTVGSALLQHILDHEDYMPKEVIGLDNNESAIFYLDQHYRNDDRVKMFIADVRDEEEMKRKFKGADIIFHTAALKHVLLCERSPGEAVRTNIAGTQNVISAAQQNGVSKVIFTSSDKAVNPTNVMGTSKLMAERLITAANSNMRGEGTIFASTRFGNVLGSAGSVVPIFHNQIASGGPVTLTDPAMSRFVMSIAEAVELVLNSARIACGGEVLITKMPAIRIEDLARAMTESIAPRYGHDPNSIEIETIGMKPGEKIYEELMSAEEVRRSVELDRYYSVLPAFRGIYRTISYDYQDASADSIAEPYNSSQSKQLSVPEIAKMLQEYGLDTLETQEMTSRYWPGDQ